MKEKVISFDGPFDEEKLVEHFHIDKEKRELDRMVNNVWTTSMNGKDGPIQVLNQQAKLWLKRKYPEHFDTILEMLEKRGIKRSSKITREPYKSGSGILGQLLLADAHIDQLDTHNTSMTQRQNRIINGVKDSLKVIDMYGPEQLLFVNLGDYFNTAINNKTAKGTEQQNIINEKDSWKFGIDLQAEILEHCSQYGPVLAKFIGGNHDEDKLHHLQDVMKYYFMNNDDITIEESFDSKQFFERGNTLFGYDHGHTTGSKNLPEILNGKRKSNHKNLERYRGHFHHRKIEPISGVEINTIANSGLQSDREKDRGYSHSPRLTGLIHNKKSKIAELFNTLR